MDPGVIVLSIPIVAIVGGIGGGIIKQMMQHQQRMAEIIHGSVRTNETIVDLQREVADLKARLNQQTLLVDDLQSRAVAAKPPVVPVQMQERLTT